jgi:hypothetical protein
VVSARQVARHIVRVWITTLNFVFSVDVVEDEQPGGVVGPGEPSQDILHHYIDVSATVSSIHPARLSNLAMRDPASAARDAALESIFAPPVQPEHRAEAVMVSLRELGTLCNFSVGGTSSYCCPRCASSV